MDEKDFSPTFMALLGIVEKLRDTINDINQEFENALKEAEKIWHKI